MSVVPITNVIRRLSIVHATTYSYDQTVTKSAHRLHLRPINDWRQHVSAYSLTTNPPVDVVEFEDVFGNFMARFDINTPYAELSIRAESVVEVLDIDPFLFTKNLANRPTLPLVWMPWELKMLQPYLTPQELPDTQLKEIYDFTTGIAAQNNQDILETLFAINLTLFKDFKYVPGSTTNATTPFEVLMNKQGVCQDFANLFITMARLLSLPARYVCGYIYTGNTGEARAQSDASHAWVQIYIPNAGWKDFDPTNGNIPHLDHVRVGYGRNWRDTAPAAGTLYSPANELMKIDVQVIDLANDQRMKTPFTQMTNHASGSAPRSSTTAQAQQRGPGASVKG